jgi:hypothetical protein
MKKRIITLGLLSFILVFAYVNPARSVTTSPNGNISSAELNLRQNMRKLWTDHVVWTRVYIIAAAANAGDTSAASKRLLKNQEDIGAAVGSYYGKDAGDKLTELLKQHIMIAVDLIEAAKKNDQAKFAEVNEKWKQNGQEIADFLSAANPKNWPQQAMRDMMSRHLTTTTDEVSARINNNYDADVVHYDEVYDHMLKMADTLSDGIVNQFPQKF